MKNLFKNSVYAAAALVLALGAASCSDSDEDYSGDFGQIKVPDRMLP